MKNLFLLVCAFLLVSKANAQDNICESGYMPYEEGISFELTSYDKKGKESSVAKHIVTSLENAGDGFKANIDMEISDPKGKNLSKGSYAMECKDGVILVDMTSMLDPRTLESFASMEMEMSGDALQIPNSLEPGQTLPDGTMMTMTLSVTNRQVGDAETVTTPAGTFDCIKISQETELKSIVRKKFNSTTWYAKGIGMVKTENYDSKGNVESSTVLTKLEE
jgi:hypothetical protein